MSERTAPTDTDALACLRICDQSHGSDWNDATVYGHHASVRICIRLFGGAGWVYDPRWEEAR